VFLPQSDPANGPESVWTPYDSRYWVGQVTLDATGSGSLALSETPDTERWQVDRIAIATSAGSATSFRLYLGTVDPVNLIDGTAAGDFDVNDAATPLEVTSGTVLTGQWSGGVPGAVATMRVHYLVERQAGS
jgi:hypothetical protein